MNETPISPSAVFSGLIEGSRDNVRSWILPADLPYFNGHFPGEPVLPAIAIIDASLEVIGSIMGEAEPFLGEVIVAKFTQTLGPGDEVVIEAKENQTGEWSVDWRAPDSSAGEKSFVCLKIKVGTRE